MNALVLALLCFVGYIIAYHTYGKFVAHKVFALSADTTAPAIQKNDGKDYVPTDKGVVFGHHFTSIAGTGPIVGPAIGVIWGWGPALIWVFFGSIFMGAVHDFSALVISMRHEGKTLSDIAETVVSARVRRVFFFIVFLALLIVIAIFGLIIALVFDRFPSAVLPIWSEIPIALALGWWVYRKKGALGPAAAVAKLAFFLTFALGYFLPIHLPSIAGIPATGLWTVILLGYAFFASTLPVTTLMQPRDYLNAWQLYVVLGLVAVGMLVTGMTSDFAMTAPIYNPQPAGAPSMWPFLFITIACGAVSGFHCLVSSGTSSKQLTCETHAKSVGYGAMLLEAALATVVIVAVTAGISLSYQTDTGTVLSGISAWQAHYSSWQASAGLGSKLEAVVIGTSNILKSLGISIEVGTVIMGVFIASFAATTLDSATRIQRYIVTELTQDTPIKPYINPYSATLIAVLSAAVLAFCSGANGSGALQLWPLFGAVNQLLAAVTLMIATLYLKKQGGKKWIVTGIPCLFMSVITLWSAIENQIHFIQSDNYLLSFLGAIILISALIIFVEGVSVSLKQSTIARSKS